MLGQMDGKLTALVDGQKEMAKKVESHDREIEDLRATRDQNTGKRVILVALASAFFGILGAFMQSGFIPMFFKR